MPDVFACNRNLNSRNSVMTATSSMLGLFVCFLLAMTASAYGYDGDLSALEPSDMEPLQSITDSDPDWVSSLLSADKRRPLSVNQALVPLSNLAYGASRNRQNAQVRNFLNSIGKRSDAGDRAQLLELLASALPSNILRDEDFARKRRGMLSIDMPLGTLSSMLQAERRRQFHDRARSAHNALASLGKRSAPDVDEQDSL
nr:DH44 [Urechis unicinctus]